MPDDGGFVQNGSMTVHPILGRIALVAVLPLAALSCSDSDIGGTTDAVTTSATIGPASSSTTNGAVTTRGTESPASTAAPKPAGYTRYPVPVGTRPHDVAPAPDGTVWFTAQGSGELGRLDPATSNVERIPLGSGSRPHGVIVGPDGAPWITDGGLNAIVRVDPVTKRVDRFDLPSNRRNANLNTAAFDGQGQLWFTGQSGVYGRLDVNTRRIEVFDAPKGNGPYGIAATPAGAIWYVSLAGSYLAQIDTTNGSAKVVELPTASQGARRVWSDSRGRLWIAEWNAGQVAMHDPSNGSTREWPIPGDRPQAYAVYVDETDTVWLTEWSSNSLVRFDPDDERFESHEFPDRSANVRQLLGRPGEVWGAESAVDALFVWHTGA
jgi:virginiamycin B lyase